MKLTNCLLLILICLIAFQKFSEKKKETVSLKEKPTITIGKRETKTVNVINKNKNPIKHSTTFRQYMDTDGRSTIGLSHNIRIGKNYYISGGITTRETSYNDREVSGQFSATKYW